MQAPIQSVAADLVAGTICGIGLAAGFWSAVLQPIPTDVVAISFLLLAANCGRLRLRLPGLRTISLEFPIVLGALLLYGLGAAVLLAPVARLIRRVPFPPGHTRDLCVDVAGVAIRTALAGGLYLWIRDSGALGAGTVLFGLAAYGLVERGLGALVDRKICGAMGPPALSAYPTELARATLVVVAGGAAALLLEAVMEHPSLRLYLVAIPLTLWVHDARRLLAGLLDGNRGLRLRNRMRLGTLARALARAAAHARGSDEALPSSIQRCCVALGERLGLSRVEREAVGYASLLVDVGAIVTEQRDGGDNGGDGGDDEMRGRKLRPVAGADLVESLSFPEPTALYVRHSRERWDGLGYPDRLSEDRIPLGSRIVAAATWYHQHAPVGDRRSEAGVASALTREAGARLDPDVVDALLDQLDEINDGAAPPNRPARLRSSVDVGTPPETFATAEDELRTLYEVSRVTDYSLPIDERLALMADRLHALIPFRDLALYLREGPDDALRARYVSGPTAHRLKNRRLSAGQGATGRAFVNQRATVACLEPAVVGTDSRDAGGAVETISRPENEVTISAPLVADGHCQGCLTLHAVDATTETDPVLRTLTMVAAQLARVLEPSAHGRPTAPEGLSDPLTGLPDARYFRLELERRVGESRNGPEPGFGILAFRVRGIPRLLENGGVAVVETTLIEIARALAGGCRVNDTLTRFGHDLFLVLTSTHRSGALIACWKRLLQTVRLRPIAALDAIRLEQPLVAAHASFPEDGRDDEALLATLESRLAQAIDHGRNVVPFESERERLSSGQRRFG